MKKYEEEHYRYERIQDKIYPWIKEELIDLHVLNGKHISENDTPVVSFIGGLKIIFVIKRGEDVYEVLKENMLPPECDIEALYQKACENLVRDVEFVIANTWYGGFGILADGHNEASSLCFKHIWQVCADKLQDDMLIMVPAKDTVLFAPVSDEDAVEKMKEHARGAYEQSAERISMKQFLFSKEGKELTVYED